MAMCPHSSNLPNAISSVGTLATISKQLGFVSVASGRKVMNEACGNSYKRVSRLKLPLRS
jgi:hypothetical protein